MFNNRYFEDHKKVQTIGTRTLEYARNAWHKQAEESYPNRDDYDTDFAWECAIDDWNREWDTEFVRFVGGVHLVYNKMGSVQFVLEPWSEMS